MTRKPNQELFRIVRFAINYPGWHLYQTDVARHVYRAARLGFLEVNRKERVFQLVQPQSEKTRVHWENPWEDAIPVPIEELAAVTYGINTYWNDSNGERFIMTEAKMLEHWRSNNRLELDAYILPQPSGHHSIGIRYGNNPSDYLSPHGDKDKVQALLDKYK